MKKIMIFVMTLVSGITSFGQLSGTYSIPSDYPSIASAVAALNSTGVGSGGVIFNVAANHTETFPAPAAGLITATGTASNPVVFQKSGAGANPKITAATGTSTTTDGIIKIAGGDYITFDGIDLAESAGNTTATTQMEWGYALVKASATAPFDGCQYVIIKNCAITLNKANTASVGIYSNNHTAASTTLLTITAPSDASNNCKFFNNLIANAYIGVWRKGFFNDPPTLCDANNEIGVDGANTISNYGGGSATSYGIYSLYQADLKVANNIISGGTGTSTLYGIFISTGASVDIYSNTVTIAGGGTTSSIYGINNASGISTYTCNIYGNTVNNCSYPTATSGAFYGIVNGGTPTTLNLYSNSVNNNTLPGTGTLTGIDGGSPANLNNYSNTVYSNTKTGTGNLYCMRAGTSIISMHDNTIHANNINTTGTVTAAGVIYGYYDLNSPTVETYYNNQIYDLNVTGTTTSSNSMIYGIYTNSVSGDDKLWWLNHIWNLSVATAGSGTIYGINSASGATINLYRNSIHGISACGPSGSVYGIYLASGTTANIYNNMVCDLQKPAANAAIPLAGIYIAGGTTANVYYNTVYLNGTSTGGLFGSAALYASTTPALTLRNNIFVNTSTPNGAGVTAAYRRTGTTLATYGSASNNNCFYAGTPSATNVIYYDGTPYQTLASYQALVTPRDNFSVTESPPFVNTSTSPYDLHLNATIPTQMESGGTVITGYDNDYDNDIRHGSAGYSGGGIAPDIGADEFGGIFLDLIPPTISYTELLNTNSTSARTLVATVTDASGVPTTSPGWPTLYWKINAGAYMPASTSYLGGNQYHFTFGTGVTTGDAVSYYIVARDMYASPNIGSYPSTGAGGFSYDPPAASTPPLNPSSYTITLEPLSGDYLIGVGTKDPSYPTISAAVADLNKRGVAAFVRFLLKDASYTTAETYPIVIMVMNEHLPSATRPVTIMPASGITSAITGSSANSQIFSIRGSYVTINGSNTTGGTSRDLTITNTSATAPQVIGISSAGTSPVVGSGVKNCIIVNGSTTGSAVVVSAVGGGAGYFNNITIQNNSIKTAYTGISCLAAAASGNGSGLLIASNDLNATGSGAIRLTGIQVQGVDGASVTGNNIGNIANTSDNANISGISVAAGTVNSSITGNTISGISGSSGAPRGIAISSGISGANLVVSGNTITGITTSYGAADYGIYISGNSSGVIVQKNKISNIKNTNTAGYSAIGIGLASTMNPANTTVKNNFIWDIAGYGYNSLTTDNGYGINISSGGGYNIYFNSISLSTSQTSATGNPACLIIGTTLTGGLDIRNNIFSITATVGTNRYAAICNASASVFATIDYNDYYTTGPNLCYLGANIPTLAAWKTVTLQDLNSVTGDPKFVAAGNLHIQPCVVSPVRNAGVPIASVTDDIDGNTRGIMPDIGAAEDGYIMMSLTGSSTSISCPGLTDGAISTLVSNGCPPYSYAWSNGATTTGLTGLSAGTYRVTVTDAISFTVIGSWTVFGPPAVACENFDDGTSHFVMYNNNGGTISNTTGNLSYPAPGSGGYPGDKCLRALDLSGGTYIYDSVDYKGNYLACENNALCWDMKVDVNDASYYPSIMIYKGFNPTIPMSATNPMFLAKFESNSLTPLHVWEHTCAPVNSSSNGILPPVSTEGTWTWLHNNKPWNEFIGDIDGIMFWIEVTNSGGQEEIRYDSLCLSTCCDTCIVSVLSEPTGVPVAYNSASISPQAGTTNTPFPLVFCKSCTQSPQLSLEAMQESGTKFFSHWELNGSYYSSQKIITITIGNPCPAIFKAVYIEIPAGCENFDDGTSHFVMYNNNGGTITNTTGNLSYPAPGSGGYPGDKCLRALDLSGGTYIYDSVDYKGNYLACENNALCWDMKVDVNDASYYPSIMIYKGFNPTIPMSATNPMFLAKFESNSLTPLHVWEHTCAPVNSSSNGILLPVSTEGTWTWLHNDLNIPWNQFIGDIDGIMFWIEVTNSGGQEEIRYDSICLSTCCEPCMVSIQSQPAGAPVTYYSTALTPHSGTTNAPFELEFCLTGTPWPQLQLTAPSAFDYRMFVEWDLNGVFFSNQSSITPAIDNSCPKSFKAVYTDYACAVPIILPPYATSTSAWLNWTGSPVSQVEWGLAGFAQGTGTYITGITAVPYILTGLNPNTSYGFYVRQDCGSGIFSEWTGPTTFTTLPINVTVTGNVAAGQTQCYNAENIITVAGTPLTFEVQTGGSAIFIAGQNILYLSGTIVHSGAYMHGYISTIYCDGLPLAPVVASVQEDIQPVIEHSNFTLYPNPTNGNFILERNGSMQYGHIDVTVYSMQGEKVLSSQMTGEKRHEFVSSRLLPGLYFVKVVADDYTETIKLIKTR